MKGAWELNWKILIGIIAAVILFIIVFAVLTGMLKPENLGNAGREICLLLVSKLKILGLGPEKIGVCDTFVKA